MLSALHRIIKRPPSIYFKHITKLYPRNLITKSMNKFFNPIIHDIEPQWWYE